MTPARAAALPHGDERLAYRGVFQRLFVRPEIGALIGVVGIWVFFWAVTGVFGTANGASNIIDQTSAPLGIMAVAVSMLMVGGEFDLSAGAMTGAMGILVILFSKAAGEHGGAGLTLHLAIPMSLAVALAIGFVNGWLVERTKLPSFTITLATYFMLWGAKLGFSKLIVDQVEVGDIRDSSGHSFWQPIFAANWVRNEHAFGARDQIYSVGVLAAIALVVVALVEMQFARRASGVNAAGLGQFVVGAAGVLGGIVILHVTDGVSGNWLGAAVIAIGTIVGLHGYGSWRFERVEDRGSVIFSPDVVRWLGIGIGGFALAMLVAWGMDAYNTDSLFFPFTHQGFRATAFLVLVGVGLVGLFVATAHARRINVSTRSVLVLISSGLVVLMAFFIRWQATGDPSVDGSVGSVKFRSEAFSVLLGLGLFLLAWVVMSLSYTERNAVDQNADRLGGLLVKTAAVLAAIGFTFKLLFVTQAELDRGIDKASFSVRTIWFLAFTALMVWILGNTRFGSWTFAVGGNKDASRQVGVPAARTKTQLFMLVSGAGWLVGMLLAFRINAIQANTGNGQEFYYIIAAVVGGTLLTGGYGTALGGALGALIVTMATIGIPFARWNSDWLFLFLGVTLLIAMLANRTIRTKAEGLRR